MLLFESMYLLKYHELPAQPGIVLSSNLKTVLLSIKELATTLLLIVSHAHFFELPNGGLPSSVGKYLSTSGRAIGR